MATKVIIVNDEDETESFKRSDCECEFCDKMHSSVKEWKTFTPETNLQKNMMAVIERIETRSQKSLRNKNIK